MDVRIDYKLRIDRREIPDDIEQGILEALSIPNQERQKAMEQNLYGWERMPVCIPLWRYEGTDLVMPRGFEANLRHGLKAWKERYGISDDRCTALTPERGREIPLRPWQEPAVDAILKAEQGIWKAPAASGKTVAVLEAIRRSRHRAIVIVNTKDILYQWQDRCREHLGEDFPVGQIGDGIFKPSSHLTISTAQTLHSRYDFLERTGFFDEFSFLCLDECHHATAETYNRLVDRFSSKIRIGVSATPDKTGDFALATNVLGPIFHTTPRKDVSILVEPHIFKIPTNFRFGYRSAQGRTPSNYGNLIKALVADHERNELIVLSVLLNEEGHSLVVSKRLEHLAILSEMLRDYGYRGQILTLTGKESSDERKRVVRQATEEPCVVFSTLADEALDIPRLDRLFLVFPQRNPGLITQQVGRVARVHPDKQDARVFDFADLKVGPLENQWRIRRLQVYQPNHYPVTVVRPEDIIEYEPAA